MRGLHFQKKIRRWHRWLGLILGIQFFCWTIGGLYFSWTSIDQIRGDDLKKPLPVLLPDSNVCSPAKALQAVRSADTAAQPEKIQLISINGVLTYQILLRQHHHQAMLVDAHTGKLRPQLSKDEAMQLAMDALTVYAPLETIAYIDSTGPHHEYREKPLPAWAITFGAPANTTVYVSATQGTVQSFRNNRWRIFDFLWMLHTMDYAGRDNINNWALRIFSAAGLAAIISGMVLFFITTPWFRIKQKQKSSS